MRAGSSTGTIEVAVVPVASSRMRRIALTRG